MARWKPYEIVVLMAEAGKRKIMIGPKWCTDWAKVALMIPGKDLEQCQNRHRQKPHDLKFA